MHNVARAEQTLRPGACETLGPRAATEAQIPDEREFLRCPRRALFQPPGGTAAGVADNLVAEHGRIGTHGTRCAFEEDRARDRALQAAGYRKVRITWRHLTEDPTTVASEIRALLTTK